MVEHFLSLPKLLPLEDVPHPNGRLLAAGELPVGLRDLQKAAALGVEGGGVVAGRPVLGPAQVRLVQLQFLRLPRPRLAADGDLSRTLGNARSGGTFARRRPTLSVTVPLHGAVSKEKAAVPFPSVVSVRFLESPTNTYTGSSGTGLLSGPTIFTCGRHKNSKILRGRAAGKTRTGTGYLPLERDPGFVGGGNVLEGHRSDLTAEAGLADALQNHP